MMKKETKYKIVIAGITALFVLKSCESCRRNSTLQWERVNNEYVVDSLNNIIDERDVTINTLNDSVRELNDSIKILNYKIDNISSENKILYESNRSHQETNRGLIKSLNNPNK